MFILALIVLVILWFWWWRRRARGAAPSLGGIEPIILPRPAAAPVPPVTHPVAPPPVAETAPPLAGTGVQGPGSSPDPSSLAPSPSSLAPVPVPPAVDNLAMIEGIGPKIAAVLQAAGITTFAHLAETELGELQQIVRDAGLRMVQVDTWPEQARLAADGEWEALRHRQGQLKGNHGA